MTERLIGFDWFRSIYENSRGHSSVQKPLGSTKYFAKFHEDVSCPHCSVPHRTEHSLMDQLSNDGDSLLTSCVHCKVSFTITSVRNLRVAKA